MLLFFENLHDDLWSLIDLRAVITHWFLKNKDRKKDKGERIVQLENARTGFITNISQRVWINKFHKGTKTALTDSQLREVLFFALS